MSRFIPTRRGNDCLICGNTSGKCRQVESLHLCMTFTDTWAAREVPGYKFIGQTKDGLWGKFIVDNRQDYTEQQRHEWRHQQELKRQQRAAEEEKRRAAALPAVERDRYYRKLLDQLAVHPADLADLKRRGLTDEKIVAGGFKSVEQWQQLEFELPHQLPGVNLDGLSLNTQPGYLCPAWDVQGQIIGFQIRMRVSNGGRYRWLTSRTRKRPNGATPHLQNGEPPISCCRPVGSTELTSIGLAEGFTKPYITAQQRKQIVIGAVGGNFGCSPQQLKAYLDELSVELNTTTVDLYPDAGAVINKGVMRHYERTIGLVRSWGYAVRVAWWGQVDKSYPDIDELDNYSAIAYISFEEFLKLAKQEQYALEVTAAQTKLNNLTYQPDIQLHEEYLPRDLWRELPDAGIVNIKSRKGGGKSTQIKQIIQHYKERGRKVLSITPRIALGREQAFKWDITWIDECGVQGDYSLTISLLSQEEALGLCWDSLWKITGKDWSEAVIIIDESELGFKHLATSSTCEERRAFILVGFAQLLEQVLSTSGLVILSDADLTNVSVDYVKALAPKDPPIFTVVNTHKGPAWDVEFFTSKRGDVESRILASLATGLKIAVPTDSQQEAEALERSLLANCPAAKVIRIDRKTTQEEFGREFVKDPNGSIRSLKPDVLIYTPSMGSGVSIDEQYFDEVVGMFFGVIEPSEARQMLARVRAPVPRIVWCKDANHDISGCKSPLPAVVKKQLFKFHSTTSLNLLNLANVLANSDDDAAVLDALNRLWDKDKQEWNSPHLDLYANIKARRNFGLTQFAVQLHQELLDEGHNVCAFSGNSTIFSDEISSAKEEIKQEEAAAIAAAEEVSIDQAKHILDNPNSKEKERHKARRAVLADSLPGVELSQELVYKALVADKGRWLAHHRLFWMLHNPEQVAILDNKQWRRHLQKHLIFLPDIHTYSLQVKVLHDIGLPELIDINREYCTDDEDVQLTLKRAIFMRHRFKTAFNLNITENTDAIMLLGRLFKRIGLELRLTRRVGPRGQQVRYYGITSESFNDSDRLTVLAAFELKYDNLVDEIGSQKSAFGNNTTRVVATEIGSQDSADSDNSLPAVAVVERSHNSTSYINKQGVMTTGTGSQKSHVDTQLKQVVATKIVEQPMTIPPLIVGTTVHRWGWGSAKYVVEQVVDEFIAEIRSLATGHTFTAFRSMLIPTKVG